MTSCIVIGWEIIICSFILSRLSFIKKIPWSPLSNFLAFRLNRFTFNSVLLGRPAAGLSPRCSPPELLMFGFWFQRHHGNPALVWVWQTVTRHYHRRTLRARQQDRRLSVCLCSRVLMEVTHVRSKAGRRFWPDPAHITDRVHRSSPFVQLYNWQTANFYPGSHKFLQVKWKQQTKSVFYISAHDSPQIQQASCSLRW